MMKARHEHSPLPEEQNSHFSADTIDGIRNNLSFFGDLVTKWLVERNTDAIIESVRIRHNYNVKVFILESPAFHNLSCKWKFEKDGTAVFYFHRYDQMEGVATCVAQRWAQSLPLWISVSPFEDPIIINLNDEGIDPGVSFCANDSRMTLVPDSVFIGTEAYTWNKQYFRDNAVSWADRSARAFWRGSTTGQRTGDIFALPRVRLAKLGKDNPDLFDVGITSVVQNNEQEKRLIESSGLMAEFVHPHEFGRKRFLINIDGNTSAWSALMEQLNSGGLVFKVDSPFQYRQWFYDRLKPWENFIPVRSDLSDLIDLVKFFQNNDELAQSIASAGQALSFSMSLAGEISSASRSIQARIDRDRFERQHANQATDAQKRESVESQSTKLLSPSL